MTKRQVTTGVIDSGGRRRGGRPSDQGPGARGRWRRRRSSRMSAFTSARSSGRRSIATSRPTGPSSPSLPATGKTAAGAIISAPVGGILAEITCVEGRAVERGALLFRLDTRLAEVAVAKAEKAAGIRRTDLRTAEEAAGGGRDLAKELSTSRARARHGPERARRRADRAFAPRDPGAARGNRRSDQRPARPGGRAERGPGRGHRPRPSRGDGAGSQPRRRGCSSPACRSFGAMAAPPPASSSSSARTSIPRPIRSSSVPPFRPARDSGPGNS